jgi:hypothetical protein
MTRAITEWQSLWGTPVLNWIPWAVGVATIPWVIRRAPPSRVSVVLVLTMLAYASARVMRIESLFIAAAAILLAPMIRERRPARSTPLTALVDRHRGWAALLVVAAMLVAAARTEFRSVRCIGVLGRDIPDQRVIGSLRHAEPGRIVTYFDWGQYAIWHLGPRLKVSMDGRRETVYSDRRLADHDAILNGRFAGLQRLAEWRPEYVWLPDLSRTTAQWLLEHGYRIDVDTDRSFVAVRGDLPRLPAPAAAAPEPCFPG